jgi:PAS domain S-box-containing protein
MEPVSVLYIAFASISLFACILQLFLSYIKRGDIRILIISILSFVIFIRYSLIFLCSEPFGLADHLFTLLRCQLVLNQLVTVCMLGVVFYLLNLKKKFIIFLYISIISFLAILSFIIPDNLFFGNSEVIYLHDLPGSDTLPVLDHGFTWWRVMTDITIILFIFFTVLILIKKADPISPNIKIVFFAGLGFIMFAALYDHLVDLGRINTSYMLPIAIFIFYMILNFIPYLFLLTEVIDKNNLSQQEKKWRNLVNEAKVIVVGLNRMGHVEFINPFFLEFTGYKEDEVMGKDWFEFFLPREQYNEVQGAFIEILEFEFHPNHINPILTKTREEKMIKWYNVRTRDQDGIIIGSLSIGVDVTEDMMEKEEIINKLKEAEDRVSKLKNKDQQS